MRRFYDVKGKNLQISALTMADSRHGSAVSGRINRFNDTGTCLEQRYFEALSCALSAVYP